jgi:hypothetical protein
VAFLVSPRKQYLDTKIANSKVKPHWHAMISLISSLAYRIIIQSKIQLIPIKLWSIRVDMRDRAIMINAMLLVFHITFNLLFLATQQATIL